MKTSDLKSFKKSQHKIACLTAYDASFAQIFDSCGVDILLVGDSLGNVVQGEEDTLGVSMDDMCYHTQIVAKASKNSLIIADMPYKSYNSKNSSLDNANRLIDCGAHMVKFEGGREHEDSFKILRDNNISVCGHLGLLPQSITKIGSYKVQGKDESSANRIIEDAILLESWGVEVIVLECIPSELGAIISKSLNIPTIGIGAGVDCDGQILVSYDVLGINPNKPAKFVKNFLSGEGDIKSAIKSYVRAVKDKTYPTKEHSY
jgi:3-methyl-2-oxobutanoate hydroxymethyltransferase